MQIHQRGNLTMGSYFPLIIVFFFLLFFFCHYHLSPHPRINKYKNKKFRIQSAVHTQSGLKTYSLTCFTTVLRQLAKNRSKLECEGWPAPYLDPPHQDNPLGCIHGWEGIWLEPLTLQKSSGWLLHIDAYFLADWRHPYSHICFVFLFGFF